MNKGYSITNVNWGGKYYCLTHVIEYIKKSTGQSIDQKQALSYIKSQKVIKHISELNVAITRVNRIYIGYYTDDRFSKDTTREYYKIKDKYNPIWIKEKRVKITAQALSVQTAEQASGWVNAKLIGFKPSASGEYINAKFRTIESGDIASALFGNPIKLADINKLLIAMGKEQYTKPEQIMLPEIGDDDMMGMDVEILIKVKKRGDFLNADGYKPSGVPSANAPW